MKGATGEKYIPPLGPEARLVNKHNGSMKPDSVIFCLNLDHIILRKKDTAKIIADELKMADITYTDILRERSAGMYEGKSANSVDWNSYEIVELANRKHEGGESFPELAGRLAPFVENRTLLLAGRRKKSRFCATITNFRNCLN